MEERAETVKKCTLHPKVPKYNSVHLIIGSWLTTNILKLRYLALIIGKPMKTSLLCSQAVKKQPKPQNISRRINKREHHNATSVHHEYHQQFWSSHCHHSKMNTKELKRYACEGQSCSTADRYWNNVCFHFLFSLHRANTAVH